VEIKAIAVHEEVPKEDATVETGRALKKQRRGQSLAPDHCRKPKEQTQGSGGSWKKLAATCRRMTCPVGVAWRKGRCRQGHSRDSVV
jgi:hypothetical protein